MHARKGLTLGKFLPLHEGHALLLRAAAAHCDALTVLVGVTPKDRYSFEQRECWIRRALSEHNVTPTAQLNIVADPDPDPDVAKNAVGTVEDEQYWSQWLSQNAAHLANVELVFTSDRYGAEIARRIGARWFPVDPGREVVPVCASDIRADLQRHFRWVSDAAKPDVAITVAVVGAESTGKSTLVRALAEHYQTRYAPEWGRTISEAHATLDAADFDAIVSMQRELVRTAQRLSNGLCFTDTEAITTALFAPIYLGEEHARSWREAELQDFDLYLLLDVAVPWVDDGTRVLDHAARETFHAELREALTRLNKPWVLVSGRRFEDRERAACAAVDKLLAEQI